MTTTVAVKSRPILFSGPMIRAILAGRKMQTRRIIKGQPFEMVTDTGIEPWKGRPETLAASIKCPYGAVGDLLWCRETCSINDTSKPSEPMHFEAEIRYAADGESIAKPVHCEHWRTSLENFAHRKRPSIHMPRWASRIALEITDVRVERLQDITEEDAKAEGCDRGLLPENVGRKICTNCGQHKHSHVGVAKVCFGSNGEVFTNYSYRDGYAILWEAINGEGSWDLNPWVFVIGFRRIEQPK